MTDIANTLKEKRMNFQKIKPELVF